jgi:2-oxoglutarate dehydrogenase E1 component
MFHMLRRQMMRPYRKPLIVMTPKSLLRRRIAMSSLDELTEGSFRPVLPEVDALVKNRVRRLVLCSGRVYYDLLEARREHGREDTAIVRIEQLYPFPHAEFEAALGAYPKLREVVWCQDEPKNQGAWYYIEHRIRRVLKPNQTLCYAGRAGSASTAAGYHDLHVQQQKQLLDAALGVTEAEVPSNAPR